MSDINCISIVGRLTRDIELKYTNSGTAIGKAAIAVNRYFNKEKEVSYFDFTIWGKLAESLAAYLKKGIRIGIVGELVQQRWVTKESEKRSKIEINVRAVQLLDSNYKDAPSKEKDEMEEDPFNRGVRL